MRYSLRSVFFILPLLIAVSLTGCGSRPIHIKGTVMRKGGPLENKARDTLVVIFYALEEGKQEPINSFTANVKEDSTFEVLGPNKRGMPAGKYRIAVKLLKGKKDLLQGEFDDKTSPIVRELNKSQDLIIDLDHPKE